MDLATGAVSEFPISTTAGVKSDPDISGRYVVWVNYDESRLSTYDIYGYDLETDTEFPICTNSAKQLAPAVSGDLVVWEDYRNNATYADIYAARIDPLTHGVNPFTVCAQYEVPMHGDWDPAVHGDTVVWADAQYGNSRVFAATVSGATVAPPQEVSQTPTRSCVDPSVNGILVAWRYLSGTTNDDIYARWFGDEAPEFALASTSQYERTVSVGATSTVWGNGIHLRHLRLGHRRRRLVCRPHRRRRRGVHERPRRHARPLGVQRGRHGERDVLLQRWDELDGVGALRHEPFVPALPPVTALKTVYVSFRDAEGHVSPTKTRRRSSSTRTRP